MENKEIKITPLYAHDCNECERCQESIKGNSNNHCTACHFIFFKKLYRDFSSGNKLIDEIIKNPVYIPSKKYNGMLNYYSWIPWERLSNINEIARGGFSIIYKATLTDGKMNNWSIKHNGEMEYERWEHTKGMQIVIKIPKNSEEVFKELNIQRVTFNNDSYLSCVTSIWGITQNAETLEYGMVMYLAEHGDMRRYLSTNFYTTSWSDKLEIPYRIAQGLDSIHSSGMVHRDLHSGNILQYYEYSPKIGDLGLSQPTNHEATTITTTKKDTKEKKIYGVIPYIPPEVLRGEKFTTAGDIYSFAMLLWELATRKPPFHDRSHDHLLIKDILNGARPKITFPLIPPSIAKLIEKCWDVNPENRPNAKEVEEKLWQLMGSESEFLESDKYVFEMLIYNFKIATMPTPIHPGAVYASRLLTAQMVDFSKDKYSVESHFANVLAERFGNAMRIAVLRVRKCFLHGDVLLPIIPEIQYWF
ncbi:hypothetical protein G9A89_008879 [Geosiphon pyriformis]|nr:hypothetical protein G9A89_008879 [Geosiphon pyriformis]